MVSFECVNKMLYLRSCPKCLTGAMGLEYDYFCDRLYCWMCGYSKYINKPDKRSKSFDRDTRTLDK